MSRVRVPGDGPKCACGKPAVWSGYCQMEDGKGYCDVPVVKQMVRGITPIDITPVCRSCGSRAGDPHKPNCGPVSKPLPTPITVPGWCAGCGVLYGLPHAYGCNAYPAVVLEPLPAMMMSKKGIPAPGDWKIDDKVAAQMVKALEEGHDEHIVEVPIMAVVSNQPAIDYEKLYPADEWFEELGNVIWWMCPVNQPPYVGTPLDSDFEPSFYTHFSLLPNVLDPYGKDRVRPPSYQKFVDHLNRSK